MRLRLLSWFLLVSLKDEAPLKPETTKSQQYAVHANLMSRDHESFTVLVLDVSLAS